MLRYIIVISMVISMCFASGVYRRCADGRGELPRSVSVRTGITICKQSPCIVKGLTDLGATIGFESNAFTRTLTPILRFYVGQISGIYDLPKEILNGCNWLTGTICPLVKNEDVIYDFQLKVPYLDEPLIVSVEYSLLNDDNTPQFCFMFDVKLVD